MAAEVVRPLSILHIEDNVRDRELVRATLAAGGFTPEITYAKVRDELITALNRGSFDLILADFSMPGFGGAEALRLVRQRAQTPAFIFVSGTIGEERAVESMKAGATDYVLKDRLDRLAPVVRRALQESREREERLAAEASLREMRERLDRVLSNCPAVIYSLRLFGGRVAPLFVTENVESILGYTVSEVLDPGWWAAHIHPEDREAADAGFERLLDVETMTQEYRMRRRDGEYRWIEDKQRVIRRGGAGQVEISGVWTDVTDRRLAADRVREQAALLEEANDAIYVHDLEGNVRFWNRAAERLYGWSADQVIGYPMEARLSHNAGWLNEVFVVLERQGSWSGEIERFTRSDQRRVVLSRRTLLRDRGGRPACVLVIDADVTDKKQLEAQFLRAQRMEAVGALAGGIAHDLNNILAPIVMAADILESQMRDPRARGMLETVRSCAKRGADLVRQVLSFARGVEGRRVVVDLADLVRETEKIVTETFPRNIRVDLRIPSEVCRVMGDPTQLGQVVMNLCVNARDAMPGGGVLSISIEQVAVDDALAGKHSGARAGNHVLVRVTDTGTGIPESLQTRIFEAFFTTKENGQGTGLGLSTAMRIVRSHGGFIRVVSEVGRGAEFRVYLPATPSEATAVIVGGSRDELPRGSGEVILVVDDEESIRTIAQVTLENFGYRVLTAANGADAVSLVSARRGEIALVLTDMAMPVMDGPSAVSAIREIEPSIQFICSSGYAVESSTAAARNVGVNRFLPKPYSAASLLQMVADALRAGTSSRSGS